MAWTWTLVPELFYPGGKADARAAENELLVAEGEKDVR